MIVCEGCGTQAATTHADGRTYSWFARGDAPPRWTKVGGYRCYPCRGIPEPTEKPCSLCKATLPIERFDLEYGARRASCHDCDTRRAREVYYRDHDKIMAKEALRRQKPEHRAKNRVYRRQSTARYPERQAARKILNNAIKRGEIQRQPCHKCGDPKGQGHHEDYSKPLDVEWICAACHAKEHRTSPEGLAAIAAGR